MANILDEIVENKKLEIESAKSRCSIDELLKQIQTDVIPASFLDSIKSSPGVALIAEVKKASPSKGLIRADFDPIEIAKAYSSAGASCISVLTDQKYFQGHLNFLTEIAKSVSTPLLRKDFVIDPYQIYEARVAGASAVLLIAECLDPNQLKDLHDLIVEQKMTPLVEFHDEENLGMCIDCNARLIGVNNRDLRTFDTDLNHVIRLRKEIPSDRCVVAESGIYTSNDVAKLASENIQAMLVGESLMRQEDIDLAVRQLLSPNSVSN